MAETLELNSEIAHDGGATMPQMNPDYVSEQLIWLVLTFTFLYVMMSRVALPRIGAALEERQDKIADDLDKASDLKREAEEALTGYEQALSDARARAHSIASKSRDKVKAETDEMRAQSDATLAEHMENAETRIRNTKDMAMTHVRDVAVMTTTALVEKLTGQSVDAKSVGAAVDAELN